MDTLLQFDPTTRQLQGPAGSLPIARQDQQALRLLMLVEGQCLHTNIGLIAQKYGYSRPRYYQLLHAFKQGGVPALLPQKTGPKSPHRRTEPVVRQVLRYLFLDPDASAEVITQKLRQTHFQISLRSVHRIIADYGLQKKTLRLEPPKPTPPAPHRAGPKARPPRARRSAQPGTRGSSTSGR